MWHIISQWIGTLGEVRYAHAAGYSVGGLERLIETADRWNKSDGSNARYFVVSEEEYESYWRHALRLKPEVPT